MPKAENKGLTPILRLDPFLTKYSQLALQLTFGALSIFGIKIIRQTITFSKQSLTQFLLGFFYNNNKAIKDESDAPKTKSTSNSSWTSLLTCWGLKQSQKPEAEEDKIPAEAFQNVGIELVREQERQAQEKASSDRSKSPPPSP